MSGDTTRPAAELAAVDAAFAQFLAAIAALSDDDVHARRREILVHLVDLDVGVSAGALPPDYVAADLDWLQRFRTRETWDDAPW